MRSAIARIDGEISVEPGMSEQGAITCRFVVWRVPYGGEGRRPPRQNRRESCHLRRETDRSCRRLAVEHVLGMLAAGDDVPTILEGYPWLEREDVLACIEYARRLVGHERIEALHIDKKSA
jgi:hypothetical protein